MDWSSEQIVGRLKDYKAVSFHHETIYQNILNDKQSEGELYKLLRHQSKPYRKRSANQHKRVSTIRYKLIRYYGPGVPNDEE